MYLNDDQHIVSLNGIRHVQRRLQSGDQPYRLDIRYEDGTSEWLSYAEKKDRDDMFWKLQNHLTMARPAAQPEISLNYLKEHFK